MKKNKIERSNGIKGFMLLLAVTLLLGAVVGLFIAYSHLRNLWLEQCVITDAATQVQISSGKLVQASTIAEKFGLVNGANIALIDFAAKRPEMLEKYPAIRDMSIETILPNKVSISIIEREPVVRMNIRGQKGDTGRVADTDGVVFQCRRGTGLLPVVREPQAPGIAVGSKLSGRTLAALRLVEMCRRPDLQELGILEVDASKEDFLCATLNDYSVAKIAWSGMNDPDASQNADLLATLTNLRDAIKSNVGTGVNTWNATSTEYIYADTKEKIQ